VRSKEIPWLLLDLSFELCRRPFRTNRDPDLMQEHWPLGFAAAIVRLALRWVVWSTMVLGGEI
jgi:hypothetical protein